jgi:hypothetical protein
MCGWSEPKIERYLMDALSDVENDRFEQHLLACEDCQAYIDRQVQELITLEKAVWPGFATLMPAPAA